MELVLHHLHAPMSNATSASPVAVMPPGTSPARRRLERWLDSEAIWPLMVAATVVYLAVFIGYPVVYNLVMSVQEVNVGNLRSMDRPFVGLANYLKLVDDPLFWTVTRNTLVFVVVNVSVQCVGGLLLAMYFAQKFPAAGWLRGLILAGWMLPPLVIGAVWKWMLTSDNGIVNHALQGLGKPAALFMYPYEDHSVATYQTDLDQWARWFAWFDMYVKNPKVESKTQP